MLRLCLVINIQNQFWTSWKSYKEAKGSFALDLPIEYQGSSLPWSVWRLTQPLWFEDKLRRVSCLNGGNFGELSGCKISQAPLWSMQLVFHTNHVQGKSSTSKQVLSCAEKLLKVHHLMSTATVKSSVIYYTHLWVLLCGSELF